VQVWQFLTSQPALPHSEHGACSASSYPPPQEKLKASLSVSWPPRNVASHINVIPCPCSSQPSLLSQLPATAAPPAAWLLDPYTNPSNPSASIPPHCKTRPHHSSPACAPSGSWLTRFRSGHTCEARWWVGQAASQWGHCSLHTARAEAAWVHYQCRGLSADGAGIDNDSGLQPLRPGFAWSEGRLPEAACSASPSLAHAQGEGWCTWYTTRPLTRARGMGPYSRESRERMMLSPWSHTWPLGTCRRRGAVGMEWAWGGALIEWLPCYAAKLPAAMRGLQRAEQQWCLGHDDNYLL